MIQPRVLNLLHCLPESAELGVQRGVRGMQEFFSLVSGTNVILENGCIDLTSLAVAAGYKFHFKNMTAMGVQVMGTLLNKVVSTGDYAWGVRWSMIPAALRCYTFGDIKFGFITYNVLAGLLLRNVFPDLDILGQYLETDQINVGTWFLDWVLKSLEGVEVYQVEEEAALARVEMMRSLRFRDTREKLCSAPPVYIQVWIELLGSWPSVTVEVVGSSSRPETGSWIR